MTKAATPRRPTTVAPEPVDLLTALLDRLEIPQAPDEMGGELATAYRVALLEAAWAGLVREVDHYAGRQTEAAVETAADSPGDFFAHDPAHVLPDDDQFILAKMNGEPPWFAEGHFRLHAGGQGVHLLMADGGAVPWSDVEEWSPSGQD